MSAGYTCTGKMLKTYRFCLPKNVMYYASCPIENNDYIFVHNQNQLIADTLKNFYEIVTRKIIIQKE